MPRNAREATARELAVFALKLHADVSAAEESRCDEAAARARERIENNVARFREKPDNRCQGVDGLFGRMAAIAGVGPGLDISKRLARQRWSALSQDIRLLMRALQEARAGCVSFAPDD